MKTNKNGVKLLVAVMAFAMVFVAGFAIVGTSDSEGTTVGAIGGSAVSATEVTGSEIGTTTPVKIIADKELTVKNGSTAVTVYVQAGKTVKLTGFEGNTGAVTIQLMNAEGKVLDTDTTLALTAFTAGTITITGTFGVSEKSGSVIEISGNPSVTGMTVTTVEAAEGGIDGAVKVASGQTFVVINSINLSAMDFGVSFNNSTSSTTTYYPAGHVYEPNINCPAGTLTIIDGGANLKVQYTASPETKTTEVSMTGIESTGLVFTVTASSMPTITSGTCTAGIITMKSGAMTIAANGSISGVTLNAYANGNLSTAGTIIGATTDSLGTMSSKDLYVNGTVAGNQTVTMDNGKSIIVGTGAKVTSLSVKMGANEDEAGMVSVNGAVTLGLAYYQGNGPAWITLPTTVAADVTLVDGNILTTDETTVSGTLTVSDSATLRLAGAMNVSGKMMVYGLVEGNTPGTAPTSMRVITVVSKATGENVVPAEFRSFDGSTIGQNINVVLDNTNAVKGIIDMAMETAGFEKNIASDLTFTQSQNVVVVNDSTIKGKATVKIYGGFEIAEGYTVTIYSGSTIEIMGDTSVVKIAGTIEVQEGAYFKVSNSKSVEVTGTIESNGNLEFNSGKFEIKNGGVVDSFGDFKGSSAKVGAGSELMISGTTTGAVAVANEGIVTLEEADLGAALTINNIAAGAVVDVVSFTAPTVAVITINDTGFVYNNKPVTEGGNSVTTTIAYTGTNAKAGYAGFNVTSSVVMDKDNNPVKKMTIGGSVEIYKNETATITANSPNITIIGPGAIVKDNLSLGESVKVTAGNATGDKLTVDGTISAVNDGSVFVAAQPVDVFGEIIIKGNAAPSGQNLINSAFYKAKNAESITFQHYTTLAKAIEAGATDIKTYGTLSVLDKIDVPKGVTVDNQGTFIVGATDKRDVTMKVLDGGILKGNSVTVYGTLEFENKKNNRATSIISDVAVIGDVSSKYTNIFTALGTAVDGDEITITSQTPVVINADITIGKGVTLNVPAGKSIVVNNNVTVIVDGTVVAYSGFTPENAFALTEAADKSALVVNGKFMTGQTGTVGEINGVYKTYGAYYVITGSTGTYTYIAPVTVAVADAQDAGTIFIYGKNSFESVKVEGTELKPVVINMTADAEIAGDFEVSTYVTVNNNGARYDGNIVSAVGSVDFVNTKNFTIASAVDSEKKDILCISGTPVKAVTTSGAPDNKVVISSGAVLVNSTSTSATVADLNVANANFSIKADATLNVKGNMRTTGMAVDGTLAIANNGSFTASEYLQVNGVFTVAEADTFKSLSPGTASVPVIYIGVAKKAVTTGADASVSAPAINNLKTIYLAAGSAVSEKVLEQVQKKTEFTVDGVLYMTVYTNQSDVAIKDIKTPVIDGAKVENWQVINNDGKLVDVTTQTVGSVASVSGKMNFDVYKITFVVDSGVTDVYVDGVLVDSTGLSKDKLTTYVAAGEHKITYKIKSGMGGDIKITLDGKTLTDGKFTITKDMAFLDDKGKDLEYKAVISGVEVVDSGSSSGSASNSDDGMGITDILLIVLVILAAVLVVIVAIRMMRS